LVFRPARAWSLPPKLTAMFDAILPVFARLCIATALLLLVLPLILVFVQSFNDVPQATMAGFRGITLRWYRQLFEDGLYFDSFWISLQLAVATSLVTIILATCAAFALVRTRFFGKSI